ncbi:MAG: hypothetical protein NZ888_06215 [Candidatus Nitrosocaldus sp.]|nr:hypothetical protein [Candidatus Nitrosocaldus sp.]MDW8000842.1 hypothetical protein [Candidatus Nitrosocaldus sp.]
MERNNNNKKELSREDSILFFEDTREYCRPVIGKRSIEGEVRLVTGERVYGKGVIYMVKEPNSNGVIITRECYGYLIDMSTLPDGFYEVYRLVSWYEENWGSLSMSLSYRYRNRKEYEKQYYAVFSGKVYPYRKEEILPYLEVIPLRIYVVITESEVEVEVEEEEIVAGEGEGEGRGRSSSRRRRKREEGEGESKGEGKRVRRYEYYFEYEEKVKDYLKRQRARWDPVKKVWYSNNRALRLPKGDIIVIA